MTAICKDCIKREAQLELLAEMWRELHEDADSKWQRKGMITELFFRKITSATANTNCECPEHIR